MGKDFQTAGGTPEPTETLPGSKDRVEILAQRAALRQRLFADGDATIDTLNAVGLAGATTKNHKPFNTGKVIGNAAVVPGLPAGFPARLRLLRKRLGLSLGMLETRCGVKAATIQSYEHGRREPKLSQLVALARGLEVTIGTLAGEYTTPLVR